MARGRGKGGREGEREEREGEMEGRREGGRKGGRKGGRRRQFRSDAEHRRLAGPISGWLPSLALLTGDSGSDESHAGAAIYVLELSSSMHNVCVSRELAGTIIAIQKPARLPSPALHAGDRGSNESHALRQREIFAVLAEHAMPVLEMQATHFDVSASLGCPGLQSDLLPWACTLARGMEKTKRWPQWRQREPKHASCCGAREKGVCEGGGGVRGKKKEGREKSHTGC